MKRAEIEPILEFGEFKEVKLIPENITNDIFNHESPENNNKASHIVQEEIFSFKRIPSINKGWGIMNKK